MVEHTKLPWAVWNGDKSLEYRRGVIEIQDAKGNSICHWTGFDSAPQAKRVQDANAQFIVRAANNHKPLIDGLEWALRQLDEYAPDTIADKLSEHYGLLDRARKGEG